MALKNYRPLTPALRFKSLPSFDEITKWRPAKGLVEPKKKTGGRNNNGRMTSRHIGGGHKQKYRKVDFKRRKRGVAAEVVGIEYDPNRSARIALIKYADGDLSYILAPDGLRVGSTVAAGDDIAPDLGNALPLRSIPLGTNIHNIELTPGRGGQIARSAGQQATLNNREGGYALVKLPSGEIRQRKSGTDSLAWTALTRARHGDEPDRSSDGRRSGEIEGGRWSASSRQSMGTTRQRI